MSITAVRPYFRTQLDAIGFTEWTDGFNFENIPMNLLDKAYHISALEGAGVSLNQTAQEIAMDVDLQVFRKGFNDPALGIDNALADVEAIITRVCAPANRLIHPIKNIKLVSFLLEPINQDNDNTVMTTLKFTAVIFMAV